MINDQKVGKFSAANADYGAFGAFNSWSFLGVPPTPPSSTGDDLNKVRVGIVRGSYVSDTSPSIGGQF